MAYFKGNYDEINSILSTKDWESELDTDDIDVMWSRFVDNLSIATKDNIPVSKSASHNFNTPWMDKETLSAVKKKRTMWKNYNYCRNPINNEKYNNAQNKANSMVKNAKWNYEKSIAMKMKSDS